MRELNLQELEGTSERNFVLQLDSNLQVPKKLTVFITRQSHKFVNSVIDVTQNKLHVIRVK